MEGRQGGGSQNPKCVISSKHEERTRYVPTQQLCGPCFLSLRQPVIKVGLEKVLPRDSRQGIEAGGHGAAHGHRD